MKRKRKRKMKMKRKRKRKMRQIMRRWPVAAYTIQL